MSTANKTIINCNGNDIIKACNEFMDKNILTIIKFCDGTLPAKKNIDPIILEIEQYSVFMLCHPCIREFYYQIKNHFSKEKTKADIKTTDKFYRLPMDTKINLAAWLEKNLALSKKVISIILSFSYTTVNNDEIALKNSFDPIKENLISENDINLWKAHPDDYKGIELSTLKFCLLIMKKFATSKDFQDKNAQRTYKFIKNNEDKLKKFSPFNNFIIQMETLQKLKN